MQQPERPLVSRMGENCMYGSNGGLLLAAGIAVPCGW